MGTVTITSVGNASFGTKTDVYNFGDAALDRMIEMAKKMYPNTLPDGSIDPNPPSANAAHSRMWGATVKGVKNNVEHFERAQDIAELPLPEPIP